MPAPTTNIIREAPQTKTTFALEPAHHLLNSLVLLSNSEYLSGYGEWITQTAGSLTPQQLHTNKLVMLGLHYAVVPYRSWSSFEAYLNNLVSHNPLTLRDRILSAYEQMDCAEDTAIVTREQMLSSADAYLTYLRSRFPEETIDEDIEREAYALMIDPPALQETVVNHLREMWETILEPEWMRIQPMLQASVDAFRQMDFNNMSLFEAARIVVDQDLSEHWEKKLLDKQIKQIIFVPSAHIGPYVGTFGTFGQSNEILWLLFGARMPEGAVVYSPDLSRSELLVRLNALADDTRLRILQIIQQEGEQCSQDIINRLQLSQSATSRHLKQLTATGYLSERRREGAKCYCLNQDRVDATLLALSHFLLGNR